MSTRIPRFPQSARFRLIVGQACFYAKAKEIRNGVGDLYPCNAATQKALDALEHIRSGNGVDQHAVGLSGTWEGLSVQINIA